MAGKLRVEYSGAIYPVMDRRDRREAIIKDDHDRQIFLATLAIQLRQETVMTVIWIAQRLQMGARGYDDHLLHQPRKVNKGNTQYGHIKDRPLYEGIQLIPPTPSQ